MRVPDAPGRPVEIRILGTITVRLAGQRIQLGNAKQRLMLAMLVAAEGRLVPTELLIDQIWDDHPPRTARTLIHEYASDLRGRLEMGLQGTAGMLPRHHDGGYQLLADRDEVDLYQFRDLLRRARSLARHDDAQSAVLLRQALSLWETGRRADPSDGPLTDLNTTSVAGCQWLKAYRQTLQEERRAALIACLEAELRLGEHERLAAELADLAAAEPHDERIAGLLMVAYYRSGRQAQAMRVYRAILRRLRANLGTSPGQRLEELYQRILRQDPTLDFHAPAETAAAGQPHERAGLADAFEKPPLRSWARLLDPRRELVDFIGREDQLAALEAWCKEDDAGRLRLISGPGGVGKTRLAVELAARMQRLNWTSEWVADGREAAAISALRADTRSPALLVVDYAETRTGLKQMLTSLAGDQGNGIRVLLLARSAGDWRDQLGIGERAVWDMAQSAWRAEFTLSAAVAADLPDTEIITRAVRSFATELGVPERPVEIYGDSGPGQRRMLDLHAAALVAVLAEAGTGPVRVDIRTVLGELLRHEQHFWYDSARVRGLAEGHNGTTTRVLRQLVAAACLLGAVTQSEAHLLAGRIPGMSPSVKITEWLRALYPPDPGQPGWIGSLLPDRLAELHTLYELADSPELGQACLSNLDARQALRAVTLLARASADYVEAEELLSQTLPKVADLIAGMQAPAETLTAIFNAIPYPTVVLAPAAAALGQQIARHLPAGTQPAVRAYWLDNLGLRLSELGRLTEALPVTQEATGIYRQLAAGDPGRYRHDLAASLNNLGVRLSEVGRAAEALPVTQEAASIYRDLATSASERYHPELAAVLSNFGVRLAEVGRAAEALSVTQEAVAVYRNLAADTGRYRAELALSLSNLGLRQSELGQLTEALGADQEAAMIRRELAAASPDRFRPDLAGSLSNLAVVLAELGRTSEAVPIATEALAMYEELAAANPERHCPDLANSLSNLGAMVAQLGNPAEALPLAEQAIAIYREMAALMPDRYRSYLAHALASSSEILAALGRTADADVARSEAAAHYLPPNDDERAEAAALPDS